MVRGILCDLINGIQGEASFSFVPMELCPVLPFVLDAGQSIGRAKVMVLDECYLEAREVGFGIVGCLALNIYIKDACNVADRRQYLA